MKSLSVVGSFALLIGANLLGSQLKNAGVLPAQLEASNPHRDAAPKTVYLAQRASAHANFKASRSL
jgi:hypothetical protein